MNHKQIIRVLDSLLEEIDLALIKAKAQLHYTEDINEKLVSLGFEEDTISGDLMRDEQ